MQDNSKQLLVGKITGLFGTRGWVKLYSYTRPPQNLIKYPRLRIGQIAEEHVICAAKSHSNKLIAQFEGIDDRDAAAALVGHDLFIDRSWLEAEAEGEFYWADLIGLQVVNLDGEKFGKVAKLMETGANDVLVVEGDRQRLIPFVLDVYVAEVDLNQGTISVDWHSED